jgi:phosphoesterase RecJ-like protein
MTLADVAAWLSENDRYLIVTHRRPDGDTLASAAALALGLKALGKTAYLCPNEETTERFTAIAGPHFMPSGFAFNHIITVDTASEDMFAVGAEQYMGKVSLAIDHHPSNTYYAERVYVDSGCAACGEIIYALLNTLGVPVTQEMALALYVAIATDTGCFCYANTTADTHRIAASLMETGIDVGEINRALFRSKTRARVELEGMILGSIAFYFDGAVSIVTITQDMLARSRATDNDTDDIASIAGGIDGVRVGVTIREIESGVCKVSVRTTPDVDANVICAQFGGGGHAMAAGCTITAPVEDVRRMLLDELTRHMS